jgi:hypothetical protein
LISSEDKSEVMSVALVAMSRQYNIVGYLPCALSLDGFDRVHVRHGREALARVCLAWPKRSGRHALLQDCFYGRHADVLGNGNPYQDRAWIRHI